MTPVIQTIGTILLVALVGGVLVGCYKAATRTEIKQVTVTDGDGVVINGQPCRLYGIDADEYDQAWGQHAKQWLSWATHGRRLKIQYVGTDSHYGRPLVILWDGDIELNSLMVELGHAWAYTRYSRRYVSAQRRARNLRLGLWSQRNPVEPEIWRRKR